MSKIPVVLQESSGVLDITTSRARKYEADLKSRSLLFVHLLLPETKRLSKL
jgi:hypothetical protein